MRGPVSRKRAGRPTRGAETTHAAPERPYAPGRTRRRRRRAAKPRQQPIRTQLPTPQPRRHHEQPPPNGHGHPREPRQQQKLPKLLTLTLMRPQNPKTLHGAPTPPNQEGTRPGKRGFALLKNWLAPLLARLSPGRIIELVKAAFVVTHATIFTRARAARKGSLPSGACRPTPVPAGAPADRTASPGASGYRL